MGNLSIIIDRNTIKEMVKNNISGIGKRRKDSQANSMFSSSTLSSAEEKLLDDYISSGIVLLLGEMSPVVEGQEDGDNVNVTFNTKRINDAKKCAFEDGMKRFVADYACMKVMELSADDFSVKREEEDLQKKLSAIVKLMFTPDPPEQSGKTLLDMKGEVILDNKPVVL